MASKRNAARQPKVSTTHTQPVFEADESEVLPSWEGTQSESVAHFLIDILLELGVKQAFGVIGGAVAPIGRAIHESPIAFCHMRHESGAGFAATEASLATGDPTVVFVTAGPGLTNVLTGIVAARWEGARVILLSVAAPTPNRGRGLIQETSVYTLPDGLTQSGPIFHYAHVVQHPAELTQVTHRLALGITRPGGFVAHVQLPVDVQSAALPPELLAETNFDRDTGKSLASVVRMHPGLPDPEAIDALVEDLTSGAVSPTSSSTASPASPPEPFALWLGFGARASAAAIRAFADQTGAPVMCTPRGKGIFPETHPQFLGVTGILGHNMVEETLTRLGVRKALVLGTRLGQASSVFQTGLGKDGRLWHVDVDPNAFGQAMPEVETHGIVGRIEHVMARLHAAWPEELPPQRPFYVPRAILDDGQRQTPVRPSILMCALQDVVVDGSDAIVMAESGNAFVWATQQLTFDAPNRFRVSVGWGSMGHTTTGVVGAAFATKRRAVALVGDGAMMMMNELNSAAALKAPATWVVLNDARYGMCHQGMESLGWTPFGMDFPEGDFAAVARALGVWSIVISHEEDLADGLNQAMQQKGPSLVDVRIAPDEMAPSGRRNASLSKQQNKESA